MVEARNTAGRAKTAKGIQWYYETCNTFRDTISVKSSTNHAATYEGKQERTFKAPISGSLI